MAIYRVIHMKKSAVYLTLVIFATSAYADPIAKNGDEIVSAAEKCIASAMASSSPEELLKCDHLVEKCSKNKSTKCLDLAVKQLNAAEDIHKKSAAELEASNKALEATDKAIEEAKRQLCRSAANSAESTMRSRQLGLPMSEIIDNINSIARDNQDFNAAERAAFINRMERMVIEAYESPRYATDEMQKKIIEDFRDKKYLECAQTVMHRQK